MPPSRRRGTVSGDALFRLFLSQEQTDRAPRLAAATWVSTGRLRGSRERASPDSRWPVSRAQTRYSGSLSPPDTPSPFTAPPGVRRVEDWLRVRNSAHTARPDLQRPATRSSFCCVTRVFAEPSVEPCCRPTSGPPPSPRRAAMPRRAAAFATKTLALSVPRSLPRCSEPRNGRSSRSRIGARLHRPGFAALSERRDRYRVAEDRVQPTSKIGGRSYQTPLRPEALTATTE